MFKKVVNYIRDFVNKCIFFYNNEEAYKENTKNILFLFLGIDVVFLIIGYFFDKLNTYNYIIFSLIALGVWFVVQVLYSFFVVPSDYIQPNMNKLSDKVGKYPVVVQYNPPKGLSASQVGMIYNRSLEPTNIDCLLYERECKGLINIKDEGNGFYMLRRNEEIDNNVPDYERRYWTMVFGFDRKKEVLWNETKLDLKEWCYINIELLQYCIEQGWLYEKKSYMWLLMLILLFINPAIFFVLITFILVYNGKKSGVGITSFGKKIYTTDKGDELLAHIIGYKYWLEKCEEEQMKKILEDDPGFKSKTFPYIVALRMNRKLLNKGLYK